MSSAAGKLDPSNLLSFNVDGTMTCSSGQVAHLLGLSEPTFRRRLRQGLFPNFPQRLPGVNKYSKPAVTAWIRSNGNPADVALAVPNGDPEIEAAVTALEARYAGAAA